jgi:hypothetical protein
MWQLSPTQCLLQKFLPSFCVSVCVSLLSLLGKGSVKYIPLIVARQRLGEHVPAATNTRNNRRIVGRVIFYAVRVLSKKSLWVCLCIPLSLLANNSVTTFPRQRRTVGDIVFYAVRVVSKENKRLVLPTTSCWFVGFILFVTALVPVSGALQQNLHIALTSMATVYIGKSLSSLWASQQLKLSPGLPKDISSAFSIHDNLLPISNTAVSGITFHVFNPSQFWSFCCPSSIGLCNRNSF